jgi:steroid delta-isomerase-like uncharacterized protein
MRTSDQARELVRAFYESVFNQRDLKFAEEHIADDAVDHNPLSPEMGNDKAGSIASLQAILDNAPDLKVEIHEMIATGDRVATRASFSGTDNGKGWGAAMGAPATGKSMSVEGIDVIVLGDDDRFIEHYGLFDVPSMMMQLGLMPGPGGDA